MTDFQLRPDRDLTVLIPARAGSKRIPGKNTKLLGGKPLMQWTIEAAQAAHVADVIVSTDDTEETGGIAIGSGCRLHERTPAHATDDAPDILWMLDVLPMVTTPYVAICRPTSPFRTAGTIRRGYAAFIHADADSIRAVQRVTHHPAKMWIVEGGRMMPVMAADDGWQTPWHSMPTQLLPVVYQQNASLEIARVAAIHRTQTISGTRIAPFFTDAVEGFDVNTPDDWAQAEQLALTVAACYSGASG